MAYFECISGGAGGGATITVTYDSSFYNKTITCSNGSKTYTKTTTSSGSTEFSVSDEGTWTITCDGISVAVSVVLSYSTEMRPTGSTATPVNDIQLWLKCGGIFNKTYTTINQVLADTTTLLALISDNNAVDYMVRSTNWANSVCANSTAMTDIGANNYCADTLLADATWRDAICNSTYFESVLNTKVPTMTSNTTPSGIAIASTEYPGYPAYKAFNNDSATSGWVPAMDGKTYQWLGYQFDNPTIVRRVWCKGFSATTTKVWQLQGSNTGNDNDWTNIGNTFTVSAGSGVEVTVNVENTTAYTHYRLYSNTTVGQSSDYGLKAQFYGRATT